MTTNRRELLTFLAASAVLAPSARALAQQLSTTSEGAALKSAKDALQVMDFEAAARRALPPAHWGYMASGVDDDLTLKANVEAFRHIGLKPRRLVDVSKPDLSTEIFGTRWETPLFICPVGGQRAFHPEVHPRCPCPRRRPRPGLAAAPRRPGRGCRSVRNRHA